MEDTGQSRYRVEQFRDLARDIPFAMFTTVAANGRLRSRPMAASENAFDGALWFFTRTASAVAKEIAENRMVNVTYVSAPEDRFVSVSGLASVVRDAEHASKLWHSAFSQWFAGGVDDPELSLIRIEVERIEFWDRKLGRMKEL
jgi:general stress protein 26